MLNEIVMEETAHNASGGRPIPRPSKMLFVLFAIWIAGAVMNLQRIVVQCVVGKSRAGILLS
jgi:protein-tyrosine phosphatase